MARAKAKPYDPAKATAERLASRMRDLEAVNLPKGLVALDSAKDIEIVRAGSARTEDGRKSDHDNVRRIDVFLAVDMTAESFQAARRLETDMRIQRAEDDVASLLYSNGGSTKCKTDRMVEAGRRVYAVIACTGPRDALLLSELIYPNIIGETWRDTVARVTREGNAMAQGARVRGACDNLAAAYWQIDRGSRK